MLNYHYKSIGLTYMLFLCNVVLNAQSVCITPPEDITWNCGEEDWLYVYTQTDDVIVHSVSYTHLTLPTIRMV